MTNCIKNNIKLSDEQQYVFNEAIKVKKNIQIIGGVAGTGKTTLLSYLAQELPDMEVAAYTGKAVDVLRKKGVDTAQTIHSLIYKPYEAEDGEVYFKLNNSLDCQGIIIDEASMVSKEIFYDLCSFNKPLIFIGDHGQLEPIGDDIGLMKNLDYCLETIHRNAGEIAFFADWIRKGNQPNKFNGKKCVKFARKIDLQTKWLSRFDQIICGFNRTRVNYNQLFRESLGYQDVLSVGEKIVCLRNNKKVGLFNGMQGIVTDLFKKNKLDLDRDGFIFNNVKYNPSQFNKVKYDFEFNYDSPNPFDYAYCLTAHRCQGSEFDRVLAIHEKCHLWCDLRWSYTVASRAKDFILWLS